MIEELINSSTTTAYLSDCLSVCLLQYVRLNVIYFSTYSGDYLKLFDGSSARSTMITSLSGSYAAPYFLSSQRYMTLQFTSDSYNTAQGFNLTYTAVNCMINTKQSKYCTAEFSKARRLSLYRLFFSLSSLKATRRTIITQHYNAQQYQDKFWLNRDRSVRISQQYYIFIQQHC